MGKWLAAVLALATLVLSGCATAAPLPVSAAQRAHIRAVILDVQWAPLADSYPEALRPTIPVTRTVTDHDWAADVAFCLRGRGYDAFAARGGYQYSAKSNETSLEFAVDGYICTASVVKQSEVLARLSAAQQQAFDDFELTQVRPCLRLVGASVSNPPIGDLTGLTGWSPFDEVWASSPSSAALRYLEQRCPPIPGWLDLSN